jgi:hypothetical protein
LSLARRISVERDRIHDEQKEKIISLQGELDVKTLKIEEVILLYTAPYTQPPKAV